MDPQPSQPRDHAATTGADVPELASAGMVPVAATGPRTHLARLALTNFRNHAHLVLELAPAPVVLVGPNGVGKTNVLEAISLLAPGQGLRRAAYADLARADGDGTWAVAARLMTPDGPIDIGTGLAPLAAGASGEREGRVVRIDGVAQKGSGALADLVEMVWLTPALDQLFTGPASERRRFLDRLVLCLDPAYRTRAAHFERAMRQRNRLLDEGVRQPARFVGLERVMAETGVAIAAARNEAIAAIAATIAARRDRDPDSPFPWADVQLEGQLEAQLGSAPAIDVEDAYAAMLASGRERDRSAGRTLVGPHRSDLWVAHGPKGIAARLSSTGEQKALLVGLVLAHAELLAAGRDGRAPLILLDEVAAHLDALRRAALFDEIVRLGAQAFMTGTDREPFSALAGRALVIAAEGPRMTVSSQPTSGLSSV